jgi:hypothetical protein
MEPDLVDSVTLEETGQRIVTERRDNLTGASTPASRQFADRGLMMTCVRCFIDQSYVNMTYMLDNYT